MRKLILFFLLVTACTQLFAAPIKKIIFFGDSLSDNGNLYRHDGEVLPRNPPYFSGRFSNNAVWSDSLAPYLKLHFDVDVETENYAFGGATVVIPNFLEGLLPATLTEEVNTYISSANPSQKRNYSSMLFAIWMGANDYLDDSLQTEDALTDSVVNEIVANIQHLINEGGEHFLVMDLPDLSKSPRAIESQDDDTIHRLHELSKKHHEKLTAAVTLLRMQYPSLHFYFLNTYDLFNKILADPEYYNKKYQANIKNTTESCWTYGYLLTKNTISLQNDPSHKLTRAVTHSTALNTAYRLMTLEEEGEKPCDAPDQYIFWDDIHPTSATHSIFAAIIAEKLKANGAFKG